MHRNAFAYSEGLYLFCDDLVRLFVIFSDITINDFANSDPSKCVGVRERKGTSAVSLDKKGKD